MGNKHLPTADVTYLARGNKHLPTADVTYWARGNKHLPTADVTYWARGNKHLPTADVTYWARGNKHLPTADVTYWARGNKHLPTADVTYWARGDVGFLFIPGVAVAKRPRQRPSCDYFAASVSALSNVDCKTVFLGSASIEARRASTSAFVPWTAMPLSAAWRARQSVAVSLTMAE